MCSRSAVRSCHVAPEPDTYSSWVCSLPPTSAPTASWPGRAPTCMVGGTSPALVAAVSNAGGLGTQGCAGRSPRQIAELAAGIRGLTDRPFGLNLLLFLANDEAIDAVAAAHPAVFATAWAFPEYDL